MPIKPALIEYLKDDATLTTLVGARIYIQTAPAPVTYPCIVIHKITDRHERHMTAGSGLAEGHYQINCYGETDYSAQTVASAVREALDNLTLTTLGTVDTVALRAAFLGPGLDTFEPFNDGSQQGIHAVKQDWALWYEESVPSHS